MRRGLTSPPGHAGRYKARWGLPNGGHARSKKGLVAIGTDGRGKPKGRAVWHKIRAEYINGTSQAKLAKKYHVSRTSIANHCRKEGWSEARETAKAEVEQKIIRKTAEVAADNATLAAGIKRKLLERLNRIVESFPEEEATEVQKFGRTERKVYKLKDLTAMYKDLTADMVQPEERQNPLLESLLALERRSNRD